MCSNAFGYGARIYNILDFTNNDCVNTLDFIIWYSYGLMLYIFYKTVIKKVLNK